MISRMSTAAIANVYYERFTSKGRASSSRDVLRNEVYDFLYELEYEAWLCNLVRSERYPRSFKDFWLRLHTGESLVSATPNWNWNQRRRLGQRLLKDLAKDFIAWFERTANGTFWQEKYLPYVTELRRRLELDGYSYIDGELLQQQQDVLNLEEEKGMLQSLFLKSGILRSADAFEFLKLSEEHFISGRWSDCISNVRKFFELTLQEGARALSSSKGQPLADTVLSRPVEVRQYLEKEGIFERKERESVDKIYGLLSETGAHPYMAEADQARLLRQLSLTLSQFSLLRLEAALNNVKS